MPSTLHEVLVLLFRNRPALAADLMRASLQAKLPRYVEARIGSAEFTEVKPVQYRADLVVLLAEQTTVLEGVIVEVQLSIDERKRYTWPHYVTGLRQQIGCPVSLLVVTPDEAVARWAAEPFELGGGIKYAPLVLSHSVVPKITDEVQAHADPELAVLSALMHGRRATDVPTAARIVAAALKTASGLDEERSGVYFDVIQSSLSDAVRRELLMDLSKYEFQSDFAKFFIAQGRELGRQEGRYLGRLEGESKGWAEGRRDFILRQLAFRFGPLADDVRTRIEEATSVDLDQICERLLRAPTLQQAIDLR